MRKRRRPPAGHAATTSPTGQLRGADRRFLYEVVAEELRRRIADSVYAAGTRIPAESELVDEFGVSTITVRRALRDLTTAGLLFGRQGLGVFVADSRRIIRTFGAMPQPFMGDEIRRAGYEPSIKERGLARVSPPAPVAAAFGLATGAVVYRHDKTVLADGEPVALDVTYLPPDVFEVIREQRLGDFLFPLLTSHGFRLDHVDFRFHGVVLSQEHGRLLGLPRGFPGLAVSYTAYRAAGRALVIGEQTVPSDRFTYEFCARPGGHPAGAEGGWFVGDASPGEAR